MSFILNPPSNSFHQNALCLVCSQPSSSTYNFRIIFPIYLNFLFLVRNYIIRWNEKNVPLNWYSITSPPSVVVFCYIKLLIEQFLMLPYHVIRECDTSEESEDFSQHYSQFSNEKNFSRLICRFSIFLTFVNR